MFLSKQYYKNFNIRYNMIIYKICKIFLAKHNQTFLKTSLEQIIIPIKISVNLKGGTGVTEEFEILEF